MKITFESAQQTCQVLGQFADSRNSGNKDFILKVQKVDGREELQLVRLSKMPWMERIVRWFGFGNATLNAVGSYLTENEPCLPPRVQDVIHHHQGNSWHENYTDITPFTTLDTETYKKMKADKSRGTTLLQNSIFRLKQKSQIANGGSIFHLFDLELKEYEKRNVFDGICGRTIGLLSHEEENSDKIHRNYKADIFIFASHKESWPDRNAVGFCYEYGIATQKDLSKAKECYREAVENREHDYASLINLGRICLQEEDKDSAIIHFTEALAMIRQLIVMVEARPIRHTQLMRRYGHFNQENFLTMLRKVEAKVTKELEHIGA